MPNMTFNPVDETATLEQLRDEVARLQRKINYLMNKGLDTDNIKFLNAEVIVAESITGDKIAAGSITADKLHVEELSAITANMGELTTGRISTNAEIDVGTDARIGNILYLNETDGTDDKGIVFSTESGSQTEIDVQSADLQLRALGGNITLNAAGGSFANGGRIAVEGINATIEVLSSDGVTPIELTFTGGTLRDVD